MASALGQGAGVGGEAAEAPQAPTNPPMIVMTNALVPASRPLSVPHTDIAASERGAMRRRGRARLAQQLPARTIGQTHCSHTPEAMSGPLQPRPRAGRAQPLLGSGFGAGMGIITVRFGAG